MRIGVPREIKVHEYRVGLVPAGVRELKVAGHEVIVESGAGCGIGVDDAHYEACGARVVPSASEVFSRRGHDRESEGAAAEECAMLRPGQVLFTYLHLAADREQAQGLIKSGATAIAYETVTGRNGSLPLLTPMSEVAGRMSIQVGAGCLQKAQGGFGVLLGGVPGVPPAKVVILGGGVAGTHAAEMAVGLRADVTVVDRSVDRLRELVDDLRPGTADRVFHRPKPSSDSSSMRISSSVPCWWPALRRSKLVTREMVKRMKTGAVLVDIAIDQGGCFETSHPTTHAEPTFVVDGVIHYCVANMPGAVPAHVDLRVDQRNPASCAGDCRSGMGRGFAPGPRAGRRTQRACRPRGTSRCRVRSGDGLDLAGSSLRCR